jgi:hypothetical protein
VFFDWRGWVNLDLRWRAIHDRLHLETGRARFHQNRDAQTGQCFLSFHLPLRPPETLGSGRVPPCRLLILPALFMVAGELKRHHGVARTLIERCELSRRIGGYFGFADTRLDLAPVTHSWRAL